MKQTILSILVASIFTLSIIAQETTKDINALFPQPKSEAINYLNFYFDTRYNYTNSTEAGKQLKSDFSVNTTRIYITSKFLNKIDFNFRYNLNTSPDQKALEFGFLEYHFNDKWSISAGQLITGWGSFEIDYNGADFYMYTNFTKDIEAYSPGINIKYQIAGQKLNLQVVSPDEEFVQENYRKKALGYLFLWEGSLFENKLKTRYGFALMQHNGSKYYNWTTIGNQLKLNNWMFEIDWMYGFRDTNFVSIMEKNKVYDDFSHIKDNDVTFSIKHHFRKVTPFIKLMYNTQTDLHKSSSHSLFGIQAAIEYYPFEENNLFKDIRLFASYNYLYYNYNKSSVKLNNHNENQIIAGFRWLIPVFKKNNA